MHRLILRSIVALLPTAMPVATHAQRVRVEETTIAAVHAAMRARTLTCRALVQAISRASRHTIKRGPALNALVVVNPQALAVADSLDRRFAREGPAGPLHCVPMIVKDNFETTDLPDDGGVARARRVAAAAGRDDGRRIA